MFVARVTGSVVSSQKVSSMIGHKLLIVEPLRVDPANRDKLIGTLSWLIPWAPALMKWFLLFRGLAQGLPLKLKNFQSMPPSLGSSTPSACTTK